MAVWYSVFIRSFSDGNEDGIGDLPGLIAALDYFTELGVDGLWLSPFHPSPSYHKYDVKDYYKTDPEFGNRKDFRKLIKEAHRRGIRIMMDLVLNHCSEAHPWFKHA
ncbi:MAG: alpha-amylase, partial [Bacteroidia bacterium]|nr:alpha-amylase [Bacteroidia bacterium]